MTEVMVAKTAGFCFGVSKAVKMVYDEIDKNSGNVYTYGPIIHNEGVVNDLISKGVKVLNSEQELKQLTAGTVIIRSHGVGEKIYKICKEQKLNIVDATCPFVKKIHNKVVEQNLLGRRVLVIGNPEHPEVIGIIGWGRPDTQAFENIEEFLKLKVHMGEKISIVSQTTYNYIKFKEILDIIRNLGYDITCFNTICNATQDRQVEARDIASKVDAMIVIGGKNSSNTRKLYEICKYECKQTIFIQTLDDLNHEDLISVRNVGITAGASTPKHIIEEVQNNVRS